MPLSVLCMWLSAVTNYDQQNKIGYILYTFSSIWLWIGTYTISYHTNKFSKNRQAHKKDLIIKNIICRFAIY